MKPIYFASISMFSAADRCYWPMEGLEGTKRAFELEFPGCTVEDEEDAGLFNVTLTPELEDQLTRQEWLDVDHGGIRLEIEMP